MASALSPTRWLRGASNRLCSVSSPTFSTCLAEWSRRLHRASVCSEADSFSVTHLAPLRALALAVIDDAVCDRTSQLVRCSQTASTSAAPTASTVEREVCRCCTRHAGVAALWGLPEEVAGAPGELPAASTVCDIDGCRHCRRHLSQFLVIWAVHVVVASWRHGSAPPASASEAVTCTLGELEERWERALREDVRVLVDFFWVPTRPSSMSVTPVPRGGLSLSTVQLCYVWSSTLFLSLCQLVPRVVGGPRDALRTAEPSAPSLADACSLYHDTVRRGVSRLLNHAQCQASTESFYVNCIARQLRTLDAWQSPSHVPPMTDATALDRFVSELLDAPAHQPSPSSDSLSLSARVYSDGLAPLWPSPLSLTRFRTFTASAADSTDDTYRSVFCAFAARHHEAARAANDVRVSVDGDDEQLIARVHRQLTAVAHQGGNRPLV